MPFVTLNEEAIVKSVETMVDNIDKTNILFFAGGFSAADEPDGSAKFIVNILLNEKVRVAIDSFIARGGLIIGICNGFQALVKSGSYHTETLKMLTVLVQPSSTMMPTNTWPRWWKLALPIPTHHGWLVCKWAISTLFLFRTVKGSLS